MATTISKLYTGDGYYVTVNDGDYVRVEYKGNSIVGKVVAYSNIEEAATVLVASDETIEYGWEELMALSDDELEQLD